MSEHAPQIEEQVEGFAARIDAFILRVSSSPELGREMVAGIDARLQEYERILVMQGCLIIMERVQAFRRALFTTTATQSDVSTSTTDEQVFAEFLEILDLSDRVRCLPNLWRHCRAENLLFGEELKTRLLGQGRVLLKKLEWPRSCDFVHLASNGVLFRLLSSVVQQLIRLQLAMTGLGGSDSSSLPSSSASPHKTLTAFKSLWAVDMFLEPIARRFLFHFSGNRQTNRLDKPEWMFSSVTKTLDSCRNIFHSENGLFAALYELGIGFVDPWSCFVAGTVNMVAEKIQREQAALLADDALFRKWLDETFAFDRRLADAYSDEVSVGSVFEESPELLNNWLEIEVHTANTLCRQLLQSPTAWQLLDGNNRKSPVNCCRALVDLIAATTDRYRNVASQDVRLTFLESVQLPNINRVLADLSSQVKSSLSSLSSSQPPASSPSSSSSSVSPTSASSSSYLNLCLLLNSADYVHSQVRELLFSSPLFDLPPLSLSSELRRWVDLLSFARATIVQQLLTDFTGVHRTGRRFLVKDVPSNALVLFRFHLTTLHTSLMQSQLELFFAELNSSVASLGQSGDHGLPVHIVLRSFLCNDEPPEL